ncbi:aminotransferase class V-fold PLP-dependent enzyme [Pseudonocardia xinjiangensis]|uniref:aminotransferase class V-fold PLP-dependent enzyme n=1 Tax=Pseudonocardia xinjiangensis TaxID=75289 RepID=UPI0028ACAF2E|nr:aminotransferase class V-fold PLP-dependent enzyme [Pseudonocardia xinjiangensis]
MTLVLARSAAARAADLPGVVGADLQVPLVTGGSIAYANLDLAASAPALQSVAAHVAELLPYYASVHRGAGYASQVSTALLESARVTVGEFVGARSDDVVVFTRNTTDALNLLAGCVPGPVLCLDVEHHANQLPWQVGAHRVLRVAETVEQTLADLEAALASAPVALLAVTGASNVTGETLPLERLVDIAHRAGARVVVDAAQLAPHRRVDLAATGIDYVALSGHKLYAPYGAGAIVGRRDWLDEGTPYLAGGGAVREVRIDRTVWAAAPHRHEGGTPNVVGAAALAQACRTLAPLLDGAAHAHEKALSDRLAAGLATVPGLRTLRIWPDSTDRVAVHSFTLPDRPAGLVAAYLSAEHGIGVRDGRFCAHPLLLKLCGESGEALRASIGISTTAEHVDRLVAALQQLTTRGARWTYGVVDGRWVPTPDPREHDPLGVIGTLVLGTGASACSSE